MNGSTSPGNAADERTLLAHAYFDDELDPVNALAVGRQVATDPVLAAEVATIDALRRAVRERLPIEPLPDHVRTRIETAIGQTRERSRPSWRALAASVAFAMAVASGVTWTSLSMRSNDRFAEAIMDGHLRALMSQRPIDVAASEGHVVKPWFNGRVTNAPTVVNLDREGFPLVGGRVDVIDTEPVATLVYGRRQHLISVFVLPRPSRAERLGEGQSIKGYNLVRWSAADAEYWAVSDLAAAELDTFVQLFRAGSSRVP
jgi:anti-sigma factor RsiW